MLFAATRTDRLGAGFAAGRADVDHVHVVIVRGPQERPLVVHRSAHPWGKLLTDRGTACSAGSVTPTPRGTVGCRRATTRRRRRLRRLLRGPLPAARSPSCIPSLRSHPGRIDVRGRPRGARGGAAGGRASLALHDRAPGVVSGPGPHSKREGCRSYAWPQGPDRHRGPGGKTAGAFPRSPCQRPRSSHR